MLCALLVLATGPAVDLDVVYSRSTGTELKMDIYRPVTASTKAAVIVIHGGAWIAGDRKDMKPLCEAFANQGMVAATVQYRFAPKTRWPGFYDDVQTAVRYLRANAAKLGIDPKRVGACGASAGGQLALLLGVSETRDPNPKEFPGVSSRVKAVFDIFGPTDMSRDFPPSYDMLFMAILGKPKKDSAAEIRAASPVMYLDRNSAAVFILHGTADPVVPVEQSRWLETRLKANGTPVESRYIDGMKHEVPQSNPQVMKAVEDGIRWMKDRLTR